MAKATVELEIPSDVLEQAQTIALNENCSVESILQEGLALLYGDGSALEYQLERLTTTATISCGR